MKKKNSIILRLLILLALIVIFILYNQFYQKEITNFEECIAAGNPAMESYPRQCRDPVSDKTFVEEVDAWRLDGIVLMQHEITGSYGCFGCNEPSEEPAMCVDPVMEMKQVDETESRYCSPEFEVIE